MVALNNHQMNTICFGYRIWDRFLEINCGNGLCLSLTRCVERVSSSLAFLRLRQLISEPWQKMVEVVNLTEEEVLPQTLISIPRITLTRPWRNMQETHLFFPTKTTLMLKEKKHRLDTRLSSSLKTSRKRPSSAQIDSEQLIENWFIIIKFNDIISIITLILILNIILY